MKNKYGEMIRNYNKVMSVINSCETFFHLEGAKGLVNCWTKLYILHESWADLESNLWDALFEKQEKLSHAS